MRMGAGRHETETHTAKQVEIYLQTEWQRSYSGYTAAKTGQFILGPQEAVIGLLPVQF